jgi:hypothetical protein
MAQKDDKQQQNTEQERQDSVLAIDGEEQALDLDAMIRDLAVFERLLGVLEQEQERGQLSPRLRSFLRKLKNWRCECTSGRGGTAIQCFGVKAKSKGTATAKCLKVADAKDLKLYRVKQGKC